MLIMLLMQCIITSITVSGQSCSVRDLLPCSLTPYFEAYMYKFAHSKGYVNATPQVVRILCHCILTYVYASTV